MRMNGKINGIHLIDVFNAIVNEDEWQNKWNTSNSMWLKEEE